MSKVIDATILEAVARHVRGCSATNDGVAPPVAILWTDPERQWLPILNDLLAELPELLVMGEFEPERRSGPAIWLRCMIERTLDAPPIPADRTPIIYMPGIARQHLRAGEDCPASLKPMVELMYRGAMWLQRNGYDWTVTAFLTSKDAVGLDIAGDTATRDALMRALCEVVGAPLASLQGKRLDAEDFDKMLTPDLDRSMLMWMSDPKEFQKRVGPERWASFCSQCQAQFGMHPDKDGETTAGERLGLAEGPWKALWRRYAESWQAHPGIADLLRRSKPGNLELFADKSHWPDENDSAEEDVRSQLRAALKKTHAEVCEAIRELERRHGERRRWLWARMGQSPMACVLEPLATIAEYVGSAIGGGSPDEMAATYVENRWRADAASWRALADCPTADEGLIGEVVRLLMESWLNDSAVAFQKAVDSTPLPHHEDLDLVTAGECGCILFADGLRYDVGQRLAELLESQGARVRVAHRWAALPTVTATAKPAVSPVAREIIGASMPDDFAPHFKSDEKPSGAARLRAAIESKGYQQLSGSMNDWPARETARGWAEVGDIDRMGHKLELRLARQLDEELTRLADRVMQLLKGGWKSVRVVTDHGWLLLPGGLPKVDLPKHLTESRWARCAAIAGESSVSVPTAPWHWNTAQRFATGPGIACFNKSPCYSHGGISLQECLIPDILVEQGDSEAVTARISSLTWKGMRCFIVAETSAPGVRADLRLQSVNGVSVAHAVKALDDGSASLVVADDAHEDADLVVVLLDEQGNVLAQQKTRVGQSS